MKTAEEWAVELREMVDHVRADPPSIGVLSMGQQCAVALVIGVDALKHNNPDYKSPTPLRPHGYTWLDCVNRIEPELLQACIKVQRELA